ncbi:MAG: restriction endonuclease subunit S [Nitrospira sp.]|nr:restriction endonuclease subunit S [Nitrospira sp.]
MGKVDAIDIRPCDLETVREILRRHVPDKEVWAFGSRVQWTARDYSDLDLAICTDEPIPLKVMGAISEELSESNLPMKVDVLDMASVSEKFRGIIEEEYAVVQRVENESSISGGRETVPLGAVVENLDSRRIPLSKAERGKKPGAYPYHGATGVMDYVDGYLFEGLHLLLAEDGSVEQPNGKPFLQLVDGRFWVNNHAHVLKGESDDDTRYLYYALSNTEIRPYITGSVQGKLSQVNMNKIRVKIT